MRIQHNIMAMNAYRNYTNNVAAMKSNLEKLSSGYKINRAGDDAAGLAISEKMRAQITGLETAQKNAKDGISLVQTAEGALTEVHDMLNRMVELATQSANGTYDNTTDRNQMQKEVNQLLDEINRIADSSNFNGIKLLDGTLGLNTDAFKITAGDSFTEAVSASTGPAALGTIHGGASVTFNNPSFTVNLKNVEVAHAANGKASITVGGVKLTSASLAAASGTAGAATIASKIAAAYKATSASTTFKLGGLDFKVTSTTAGVLKFTAVKGAGAAGVATATAITASKASAFNAAVKGATVQVVGAKDDTVYDHAIEDLELAVSAKSGGLFGADLDMSKVVADGNKLTVGTATYTFNMSDADSTITASKTVTIDTRKFTTASAQTAEAIRLLSAEKNIGGGVNISAKDATHIHVDIKDAAAQTAIASTEDKFKDLFEVTIGSQASKAASTKLTVNGTIQDGNTISITDGSVTTKYIFGKGTDVTTGNNRVKYVATKTAEALKNAIGGNASLSADKKTITIKAAKAAASVAAPTVLGKGLTLQIGDTSDSFNQLNVSVQDMHADSLGIGGLNISTEEAAQAAVNKIKNAINMVSDVRGTLGATQNRLDHTINNLSVMTENIQDAESTIRDTDVAEEMMAYTKNNILIQSAQAMLAQANQVPQGVLQLLG